LFVRTPDRADCGVYRLTAILPAILPTGKGRTTDMAELKETLNRHAQDVVNGNVAGLMGDFAPEAMSKVMGLAANPITATSFEVKELGNNEAEISYIGATTRKVWSKWADNGGKFQIVDVKEL
jgi:hypothetical protein